MLPNGLDVLTPGEWTDAIVRATKFAHSLRRTLPRHLSVDDLVHTAVEQVLDGTRSFDLKKHTLAGVLCNTIRSILSPKGLAEYRNRMPLATEEEQATAPAADADGECLFSGADRETIMQLASEKSVNDAMLVDYIAAFQANFSREETAELLGVRVEDCYELQRKMKSVVISVIAELKPLDRPTARI